MTGLSAVRCVVATCVLGCGIATAYAQPYPAYPTKPLRVLVGFQPGGGSDILARTIGQKLTESWGQPVITDNRSGAGGTIAMEIVAASAPDGYTLLLTSGSQVTNASLVTKVKFNVIKAFAPISQMTSQPYVWLVHPSVPVRSVKEMIAYAKIRPGALNFGSSGTGSSAHLGMELFKHMAKVDLMHVPYKGSGQALIDLLAGQVQMLFASAISSAPHLRSGRLRAIAVSSAKRFSTLPDIPTVAESGLPGFEFTGWYGISAPARTSRVIIGKLNQEIVRLLQTPDVLEKLAADGAEAAPSTSEQFRMTIENEIRKWTKVVREAGIKLE